MRSLSSVCASLVLILCVVLVVTATGASQKATFQGSLTYGVDQVTLQQGGGTLSVVLKEGRFKDLPRSDMVTYLNAALNGPDGSSWNVHKLEGLTAGLISINFQGRQLRVTLGPMPEITVASDEVIAVSVPSAILEGVQGPLESTFHILPPPTTRMVSISPSTLVAGSRATISYLGVDEGSEVYLVQGGSCFGERAMVRNPVYNTTTLSFLPLRGGTFSLCFSPPNAGGHVTQFKESITISGPEAIKADPQQPRSLAQFFVSIYGVNMTSQDLVAMTTGSCDNMDIADIQINDAFSSPTRGGFYATAREAGEYHVCYYRDGAESYVDCGQVNVLKGSGNIIEGKHDVVVVDRDTLIASNAHIGHLMLTGGTLSLDGHKLNVSQLSWKGGNIVGPGSLTLMGDSSEIDGTSPKVIDFDIYNYGHLVLLLGDIRFVGYSTLNNHHRLTVSTLEQSAAPTLRRASIHNVLRNAKGATAVFRQEVDIMGASVDIGIGIDSAGTLELQGSYNSQALFTRAGSVTTVTDTSSVVVSKADLQGSVSLGEHASVALMCPISENNCVVGAVFEGESNSLLHLQGGNITLNSVIVNGPTVVQMGDSADALLNLQLEGTSLFTVGTVTSISHTNLLSPRGAILNFVGRLVVNLDSTTFGDKVVMESRLSAVMFANGDAPHPTRIVPQRLLKNATFVVPLNASLVILDSGNYTRNIEESTGAVPALCSYFVVVPMYVVADGDMALMGCAMLPFGGALNGKIFGTDAELVESTMRYALCQSAIFGGDSCAPLRAGSYPSGLALEGKFTRSSNVPVTVDSFHMNHGTLESSNALTVVSSQFNMDAHSSLVLSSGGLLKVPMAELHGLVRIEGGHPLMIEGDANFHGGSVQADPGVGCQYPLQIHGEGFLGHSVLQCSNPIDETSSSGFVRADRLIGYPMVDTASCASEDFSVDAMMHKGFVGLTSIETAMRMSLPMQLRIAAWTVAAVAVLLVLLFFNLGARAAYFELVKEPPLHFDILWSEFNTLVANGLIAIGLVFEALFLSLPAFVQQSTLPPFLGWLAALADFIIAPRSSTSVMVYANFALVVAVIWALAWFPLSARRFSESLQKYFEDYRQNNTHRSLVSILFRFHTIMALLAPPFFIPAMSILLDVVLCSSVSSAAATCAPLRTNPIPYALAAAVLAFLVPYSGSNRTFSFLHPPYQRDLDIRFKRVYVYVKHAALCLILVGWKVTYTIHVQQVIVSMLLGALLLGITWISRPSAYRNVNWIVCVLFLFGLWAECCTLAQGIRFKGLSSTQCAGVDYVFTGMVLAGWVVIVFAAHFLSRHQPHDSFDADPAVAGMFRIIVEGRDRIEECRADLYNSSSARERDVYSHNLTALRIRQIQNLANFRRMKERYLLPFYLDEETGREMLAEVEPEVDTCSFDQAIKPQSEEQHILTPEVMDSYNRGPLIGSGSYGEVYMGMLSTGKLVAVKEIRISVKRKSSLNQVRKEVNVLRSFNHRNVISYYGCHVKGGKMYVFMEFAVGGSLTSHVRKFVRLSEPVIRMYTQQVLVGLAYLHDRHIIHRDIKGENILIDSAGVAKLADFGCSKALADIANKSREGCDTLIGSPYWMAPEVIKNQAYGTKADIWSVGCTVVEMLNGGSPPWSERFESVYSAMYHIGNTQGVPSNIPSDISGGCRQFLMRCFDRDVGRRASAQELLADPWLREVEGASSSFPSTPMIDECEQPTSPDPRVARVFRFLDVTAEETETADQSPAMSASYDGGNDHMTREMSSFE